MKSKTSKLKKNTKTAKPKSKKKGKLSKKEIDHIMDRTQVILGYEQISPSLFELTVDLGKKTPKQDGVKIVDIKPKKKKRQIAKK